MFLLQKCYITLNALHLLGKCGSIHGRILDVGGLQHLFTIKVKIVSMSIQVNNFFTLA